MTGQERSELQRWIQTCKTQKDLKEMETKLKRRRLAREDARKVSGGAGRTELTPEEAERVAGGVYYFTEAQSGARIPFHKDSYTMGTDYWYDQAAIIECMFEAGGFDLDAVTDFIVNCYGGSPAETKDALMKGPFFWADARRQTGA